MSTPTVAEFRVFFPEYSSGPPDATVQAHIDHAEEETPESVWGAWQDQSILYLAAHTISLLPNSQDMRLDPKSGSTATVYSAHRHELRTKVPIGPWVAGISSGFRLA